MSWNINESEFLQAYDPAMFARPSVTVDLALMTVRGERLCALLQRRADHPYRGHWALPGGFVGIEEGLDDAARRVLTDKAGLAEAWLTEGWLEQLYTFGEPERDPRMRIISVAYYALLPTGPLLSALADRPDLMLAPIHVPWGGDAGGAVAALDDRGEGVALAFDHAEILGQAVKRLRGKLAYAPVAFALLPPHFTLRALQNVHEAILDTTLNKPAFRRRMLDTGWIAGTGLRESGTSYRPAELYRHILQEGS